MVKPASTSGFLRVALDAILQRLEFPPRPVRDYTSKLNPSTEEDTEKSVSVTSATSRDSEDSESLREQLEVETLSTPQAIEKEKESSVTEKGDFKTNGEEDGKDVATRDTPQERPQRLKKLLGRSRKPDVGTQEPQMRAGWSLV